LRRNPVSTDQIATVIGNVTTALQSASKQLAGETVAATGSTGAAPAEKPTPAVSVRRSIQRDRLICLECGKPQKTLKRHLSAAHGTTPQEYRAKWGLARDYPMSAPAYSEQRSEMAKKIGLGAKGRGRRRKAG
jgi:predicted transcriptional regulator